MTKFKIEELPSLPEELRNKLFPNNPPPTLRQLKEQHANHIRASTEQKQWLQSRRERDV
jgi:hypothetical protein